MCRVCCTRVSTTSLSSSQRVDGAVMGVVFLLVVLVLVLIWLFSESPSDSLPTTPTGPIGEWVASSPPDLLLLLLLAPPPVVSDFRSSSMTVPLTQLGRFLEGRLHVGGWTGGMALETVSSPPWGEQDLIIPKSG